MQKKILDPSLERAIALQTDLYESSVWTHWLQAATISTESALLESLQKAGFSRDYVIKNIQAMLDCSTEGLIEVQLGQERFDTPYLSALKLRCSSHDCWLFRELCLSQNEKNRELGVSLSHGDVAEKFPKECLETVLGLVLTEKSELVIVQLAYALKKFNVADRAAYLRIYVNSPNVALRESIAFCLAGLDDELSADLLIALADDEALPVRSWSIYNLAYSQFDSNVVRQALRRALDDSDLTVVQQAVLGLARRQDPSSIDYITQALESGDITRLTLEAISAFPHRIFTELLMSLKPEIADEYQAWLDSAITSCMFAQQ